MNRIVPAVALLTLLAACGDDGGSNNQIFESNISSPTNMATNNVANNTSANTSSNNTSANSVPDNVGTAAVILAETSEDAPANMPCQADVALTVGADVFAVRHEFGYDLRGRLKHFDSYENGVWKTREARRYLENDLYRTIIVGAEDELIELVFDYSYDAGRIDGMELSIPDMLGTLNPPFEITDFEYDSENEWTTTTFDSERIPLETESYVWDPQTLTFTQTTGVGEVTVFEFETAPPLENLYRVELLEPWQLGGKIAGGTVDDDGDGEPETMVITTYDGERLTGLSLDVVDGGSLDFVFSYVCE